MRKEQALSLLELIADLYTVANSPEPQAPLTFDLDPDAAVEEDDADDV